MPRIGLLRDSISAYPNTPFNIKYEVSHASYERPGKDIKWSFKVSGDPAITKLFTANKISGTGNTELDIEVPAGSGLSEGLHTIVFYSMVNLTDSFKCESGISDTLTIFISKSVNKIGSAILPTFVIYPNPSKNLVLIDGSDPADLTLFSIRGEEMFKTTTETGKLTLDISAYPSGIYIFKFKTNRGDSYYRVVKH